MDAHLLSTHPLEALLQLDKAARDSKSLSEDGPSAVSASRAATSLVVMPADVRLDPNLKDAAGEHFDPRDHDAIDARARQLVAERRGDVRLIGPLGALVRGPGDIALVAMLGPAFPALAGRFGDRLGHGVDLGLGWDMTAGEVLAWLAASPNPIRAVALALPPSGPARAPETDPPAPWTGLALGIAELVRRGIPVFAVATESEPLAAHGVTVTPDLNTLVDIVTRPAGALAVVSALGADTLIDGLVDTFGLELADLSEETLLALERELPRATRLGPHLKVPGPNARHLDVIRNVLGADPAVGRIWFALDDADPWASARRFAALASTHSAKSHTPLPIADPAEPRPRMVAELLGLRLMKRLVLERDQVVSLLGTNAAPSWPVSSLAAALDAAQRIGYPVRLEPSTPLADREALTQAWEAVIAELEAPSPTNARAQDAWHARRVLPARAATHLRYTSHPLPLVHLDGHALPLPARLTDVAHHPTLEPILRALTDLAANHPEVASLELEVDRDGILLDASGVLLALPA